MLSAKSLLLRIPQDIRNKIVISAGGYIQFEIDFQENMRHLRKLLINSYVIRTFERRLR